MFWMISDIFSAFDPYRFTSLNKSTIILLISNIALVTIIQLSFWITPNRVSSSIYIIISIINEQVIRTFTRKLKGINSTISNLFILIIAINLIGLIPYTFSLSSHLIFTLTFGLPIWLSFLLSSYRKTVKASLAHLLPDGAPRWLNPFLILIETTRIIVRPLTLSFRLAANISAGHIVLGLINIYCSAAVISSLPITISLLPISIGYILFEVAICLIQAYIFCLLLTLYANDHAH